MPLGLVFGFSRSGSHLVASNLCVFCTEELEHYMLSEGFAKNDIERVLMMKYVHDKKQNKS
jgi:hypothetical protein